jgi:uncharacterized membrane protein YjfL (UPF0719 family)
MTTHDNTQVLRAVAISFALAIVGTVIGLVLTRRIARRRAS